MGLFSIKNKQKDVQATPKQANFENLPLFDKVVAVDCFNNYFNKYDNLHIQNGTLLKIAFEPSVVSNSIDAVVYLDNYKLGYLPYGDGKWLRLFFKDKTNFCEVVDVQMVDDVKLLVKIKTPYENLTNNLPLQIKLVGVTFENRQEYLKQSFKGDLLLIKHEPTAQYPNLIKVYNTNINQCVGVIPDITAAHLIKKFKQNCSFNGVIYSLYGAQTIGVDIVILNKEV